MLMGCKAVQQADQDMKLDAEAEDAMVEWGLYSLMCMFLQIQAFIRA